MLPTVGGVPLARRILGMAKSKADLESDHRLYRGAICKMQRAIEERDYLLSIRHAKYAWQHIDGMIQYESRYLDRGDFANIECVGHVLQFAPIVFDKESLEALSMLIKSTRRVDRCTPVDLADELAKALQLLSHTHGVWCHIENHQPCVIEECRAAFQGDDSDFYRCLRIWRELELIDQYLEDNRQCLKILTFGDSQVRAKCSACGVLAQGLLSQFLNEDACPLCQENAEIVLLRSH
jgi:hypothetical protein